MLLPLAAYLNFAAREARGLPPMVVETEPGAAGADAHDAYDLLAEGEGEELLAQAGGNVYRIKKIGRINGGGRGGGFSGSGGGGGGGGGDDELEGAAAAEHISPLPSCCGWHVGKRGEYQYAILLALISVLLAAASLGGQIYAAEQPQPPDDNSTAKTAAAAVAFSAQLLQRGA